MVEDEKRFLLPGDEIGTTEEYISGEGTFEKDGIIYASNTGFLEIDKNEMIAKVKSTTSVPNILNVQDLVFGVVFETRDSMAIVEVVKAIGRNREIAMGDKMGSIHISKVQNDFLKEIGSAFKIGDIVRAKVVQVEPSLQLVTQAGDLGVVLAKCTECQVLLERKGKELQCPRCERHFRKKLANDYGRVQL